MIILTIYLSFHHLQWYILKFHFNMSSSLRLCTLLMKGLRYLINNTQDYCVIHVRVILQNTPLYKCPFFRPSFWHGAHHEAIKSFHIHYPHKWSEVQIWHSFNISSPLDWNCKQNDSFKPLFGIIDFCSIC